LVDDNKMDLRERERMEWYGLDRTGSG
jgi:hypothetical protein